MIPKCWLGSQQNRPSNCNIRSQLKNLSTIKLTGNTGQDSLLSRGGTPTIMGELAACSLWISLLTLKWPQPQDQVYCRHTLEDSQGSKTSFGSIMNKWEKWPFHASQPSAVRADRNKNRRVLKAAAGTTERQRTDCEAQPLAMRAEIDENRSNTCAAQEDRSKLKSCQECKLKGLSCSITSGDKSRYNYR